MIHNQGKMSAGANLTARPSRCGFFVWDIEADSLRFCEQASRLLALSADEARRGMSFPRYVAMIHPDDRLRIKAEILRDGEDPMFRRVYRLVRPDGETIAIRVVGSRLRNGDGRVIKHVGAVAVLGSEAPLISDEAIDHFLAAYVQAGRDGNRFLQYLVGMVLVQLGFQIAQDED